MSVEHELTSSTLTIGLGFLLIVLLPSSFGNDAWFSNLRTMGQNSKCNGRDKDRIEFYGKPCNYTMFYNTSYAEAWRMADRKIYKEGEKLFNKWVTEERCNQTVEWRQEVCDGWSLNLLGCILNKKNDTSDATCGCLETKLTEFDTVNATKPPLLTLCRVKKGKQCSQETTALHCADKRNCEANICCASLKISISKFLIVTLFSICRIWH